MTDPAASAVPPGARPEDGEAAAEPTGGGHARRLASGSLVQIVAQVTGLLTMLAIITVLAHRLSATELGVYALLTSLAGYLLVIQNAAASAAVRNMAAASDADARSGVFSTATALYAAAGAAAGVVVMAIGLALAAGVDLSAEVARQARLGSVGLGVVTALGWPLTISRDALRAARLFVRTAVTEIASLVAYAALVLGLAFADAPLWLIIGASGAIPLLAGLGCTVVARASRLPYRFRRRAVERAAARELLVLAGYVSLTEAASAVIYALSRVILGLFSSAAAVGIYEGPVRAHNLIRALNAAVSVTVVPSGARYYAEGESARLRELLVRGCRYMLALIVPLAVTGMALAAPLLDVWLGEPFRDGGLAMAILLSHWLVNGTSGVLAAVLVAVGRARRVAIWAAALAAANLVLALALTPGLELEGVTLATAVPYIALFPLLLRAALDAVPVAIGELAREAFLPAWALGAALACVLVVLRLAVALDSLAAVLGAAVGGVAVYWLAYYLLWLRPAERALVRDVALRLLGRAPSADR